MLDRVDRTERVAFVDREQSAKYRGLNPSFYRRAQRNQRLRAERKAREQAMRMQEEEKAKREREREHMERLRKQAEERFRKMVQGIGSRIDRDAERPISIPKKRPVRAIIADVSERTGIPVREILGPRRSRHIVAARFLAIKEAALERPDLSLPQLGRQFGGRDHTTILSALRKMGVDTARAKASQ